MFKRTFILIFLTTLFCTTLKSQEILPGTWKAESTDPEKKIALRVNLMIGNGESQMLYPAKLTLTTESFSTTIQFILLKKSTKEFWISTSKFIEESNEINLQKWSNYFTGKLSIQRDLKGNPKLEFERNWLPKEKNDIGFKSKNKYTILDTIASFFADEQIRFEKTKEEIWNEPDADSLLQSRLSPAYFGISDTFFVSSRKLNVKMKQSKDNDIVSVKLLNTSIWDQVDAKKIREDEVILLDTGLNILGFFVEDFGKTGYSNASISFNNENSERILDFENSKNRGLTFIGSKIYCKLNEDEKTSFEEGFTSNYNNDQQTSNPIFGRKKDAQNGNNKKLNTKTIGNLKTKSSRIKFAVWDDAVEDGDTISIMVNGTWVASGLSVKKKPQFLEVGLKPGQNEIIFQADNLGSIVPNTSVVEIIDGKKRKSYFIETDLNNLNRINIQFEVPKP
jgi:hypothetical protein